MASALLISACGNSVGSVATQQAVNAAAKPSTAMRAFAALDPAPQIPSDQAQYLGYGIHYPQGVAAVQYLYSASGTFTTYSSLWYYQDPQGDCSYYSGWTSPSYDPTSFNQNEIPGSRVQNYVTGSINTAINNNTNIITPDANNHLLYSNSIGCNTTLSVNGQSFFEHNATGVDGNGNITFNNSPYFQFWFDDNWLARYMSQAYGAPLPTGLWNPSDFTRWKIIGNDTSNWTPYENNSTGAYDQLALDGMYYLSLGQSSEALSRWNAMLSMASTAWDSSNQRYTYPNIYSEYHLGLFKILTDQLIASNAYAGTSTQSTLIQHAMSMRSDILSDQLYINGAPAGWVTGDGSSSRVLSSLINTETTALDVLALGAEAKYSFEAGQSPLVTGGAQGSQQFFVRPYGALSAVVGLSPANTYMTYGPYMNLPTGSYTVDFYLRAHNPSGNIANVDIHDANSDQILGSYVVTATDFSAGSDQWVRVSVPITITNSSNSMEFRVWWYGSANLDLATIRLR